MKDWLAWMSKYLPDADVHRPDFVNGYNYAATMVQVLKQAGGDLSRENIMRQATNLRDLELPMLLPGSRCPPVRRTIIRSSSCSSCGLTASAGYASATWSTTSETQRSSAEMRGRGRPALFPASRLCHPPGPTCHAA